jgi:hypothetical protein
MAKHSYNGNMTGIFYTAFQETQSMIFGMMAVVRAVYHSILGMLSRLVFSLFY